MYDFSTKQDQTKKTTGKNAKNKCNILVIHHSGWPTYKSFLATYQKPEHIGSYHFVIDEFGKSHKFGEPTDIARHAGASGRWPNHPNNWKKSINPISLGLCVIWPLKWGGFNQEQRQEAVKLTKYLVWVFKIGKENLVRHIDITQYDKAQIKGKKYYAGKGLCRKVDISPAARDRNKFLQQVWE